ncbi:hypothetical protein NCS52_00395900 [Fusarium sp. LHS14.1]|nr:hypothetical protein NCS52_00395900 [Fusarium sp. LHS14.1]
MQTRNLRGLILPRLCLPNAITLFGLLEHVGRPLLLPVSEIRESTIARNDSKLWICHSARLRDFSIIRRRNLHSRPFWRQCGIPDGTSMVPLRPYLSCCCSLPYHDTSDGQTKLSLWAWLTPYALGRALNNLLGTLKPLNKSGARLLSGARKGVRRSQPEQIDGISRMLDFPILSTATLRELTIPSLSEQERYREMAIL